MPGDGSRSSTEPGKAFEDLETGQSTAEWMLVLILVMSVVLCAGIVTLPVALDRERALIESEFQSYSDLNADQQIRHSTRGRSIRPSTAHRPFGPAGECLLHGRCVVGGGENTAVN